MTVTVGGSGRVAVVCIRTNVLEQWSRAARSDSKEREREALAMLRCLVGFNFVMLVKLVVEPQLRHALTQCLRLAVRSCANVGLGFSWG